MSTFTHPVPRAIAAVVRKLPWFAGFVWSGSWSRTSVCRSSTSSTMSSTSSTSSITIALVATYVRVERVDVVAIFGRRWRWSLGLGVVVAAFLVFNVFNTEDATSRPHGAYFVFELLWRGVGYGVIDTLLLTIFPCFVAHKLLHGRVDGLKGKLRFTALTLPLVLIVTATYHWGYPQYRQDGLSRPETGNVLISVPRSQPRTLLGRSSLTFPSTSPP